MGAFFAKEILEAAVQVEKNGQRFYELMGQRAKGTAALEVFQRLARQEQQHLAQLKEMAQSLADPPETWEREEFAMYMAELADSHVFGKDGSGDKAAQEVTQDLEAVELGIRFEKDTLLFMEGLRSIVRKEDTKVVDKLLDWERQHLVELVRLKWQLTGKAKTRS